MDDLQGTSNFAGRPETCCEQVQSFLTVSADYLGLAPDANRRCRGAMPGMALTGYHRQVAPGQGLEGRL
jgi:hypothetical protein